jgi:hypothetical protein
VVVLDSDGSHLSRIISFRIGHGLPVSFAVPPGEAEELRKQLGQTVKKSKAAIFHRVGINHHRPGFTPGCGAIVRFGLKDRGPEQ